VKSKVWQELTGGSGKSGDVDPKKVVAKIEPLRVKATADLAPVEARITQMNDQIEALKKQAGELKAQGKDADPAVVADVKTRLTKAQGDLDPLRNEKRRLDDQIKRLSDMEKKFDPKGGGDALLKELEASVVKGGGWHDPMDAMHFSSMTPIPGLVQPGMG
jgi:chromosome segregation ATPase